ncbi:MAG: YXWGXW repeat-containing protein [Verrucomicrobia bacterium]|nr:YXWGXW repeat-containing protein [Verrucomicrobiota bacterium]MBV9657397.1 YXWGXW repeat-containing protein [Verrucomicrobiota bacterium]
MKLAFQLLPLLPAALLLGACTETVVYRDRPAPRRPVDETIIVERGPYPAPAPIVERRPIAPFYGAVWVPGHWRWNGHRYVWARGHYRRV